MLWSTFLRAGSQSPKWVLEKNHPEYKPMSLLTLLLDLPLKLAVRSKEEITAREKAAKQ